MKKILSLLLACTMIFSFAAISVNAEGEAYALNYYDVELGNSGSANRPSYYIGYVSDAESALNINVYDSSYAELGTADVFALSVSANVGSSGGQYAIAYDSEVVYPIVLSIYNGAIEGYPFGNIPSDFTIEDVMVSDVLSTEFVLTSDGLAYVWYNLNDYPANEDMVYFHFAYKDGKSEADLNADSFKFVLTDSVNAEATQAFKDYYSRNGVAGLTTNDTVYGVADASNANRNYPNVDVEPEGDKTNTLTVAGNTLTANVYYDENITGKVIIAAYNANGTMLNHNVADISAAAEKEIAVTVTNVSEVTKVKVFAWGDFGGNNNALKDAIDLSAQLNK